MFSVFIYVSSLSPSLLKYEEPFQRRHSVFTERAFLFLACSLSQPSSPLPLSFSRNPFLRVFILFPGSYFFSLYLSLYLSLSLSLSLFFSSRALCFLCGCALFSPLSLSFSLSLSLSLSLS